MSCHIYAFPDYFRLNIYKCKFAKVLAQENPIYKIASK